MTALSETGFFLRPFDERKKSLRRTAERLDRAMRLGVETIMQVVDQHDDPMSCFDELMWLVMGRNGLDKRGWAEKSPRNCEHYRELADRYADLYFISMIRNGRDVVTSVMPGRKEYHCSIERYCYAMECVYGFVSPRHIIVRYEDLVANPEAELRRIFRHIDEPYEPAILERYKNKTSTRNPASMNQPRVFDTITADTVERWRLPEHSQRISLFDANADARQWNVRAGYAD